MMMVEEEEVDKLLLEEEKVTAMSRQRPTTGDKQEPFYSMTWLPEDESEWIQTKYRWLWRNQDNDKNIPLACNYSTSQLKFNCGDVTKQTGFVELSLEWWNWS